MVGEKVKSTLDHAEHLYLTAHEEWCKPEEDVVPYMICSNLYESVHTYLRAFLLQNGVEIHENLNVEKLWALSKDLDTGFGDLKLEKMLKVNTNEKDWMGMDTVSEFIDMAKTTRNLVRAKAS